MRHHIIELNTRVKKNTRIAGELSHAASSAVASVENTELLQISRFGYSKSYKKKFASETSAPLR